MSKISDAFVDYDNQFVNISFFERKTLFRGLKIPPNKKYYKFLVGTNRADRCHPMKREFEISAWEEDCFGSKAEAESEAQKIKDSWERAKSSYTYKNILMEEWIDILQYEFGPIIGYNAWEAMSLPSDREILRLIFGEDLAKSISPTHDVNLKIDTKYICLKILKDAGIETFEVEKGFGSHFYVRRKDINRFLG